MGLQRYPTLSDFQGVSREKIPPPCMEHAKKLVARTVGSVKISQVVLNVVNVF